MRMHAYLKRVQFQKFLPAVSFINCKEKRNQVQLSSTSFILF